MFSFGNAPTDQQRMSERKLGDGGLGAPTTAGPIGAGGSGGGYWTSALPTNVSGSKFASAYGFGSGASATANGSGGQTSTDPAFSTIENYLRRHPATATSSGSGYELLYHDSWW